MSENNSTDGIQELQNALAQLHVKCLNLKGGIPQYEEWIKQDKAALKKAEAERNVLSQKIIALGHEPLREFTKEDIHAQRQELIESALAESVFSGHDFSSSDSDLDIEGDGLTRFWTPPDGS